LGHRFGSEMGSQAQLGSQQRYQLDQGKPPGRLCFRLLLLGVL